MGLAGNLVDATAVCRHFENPDLPLRVADLSVEEIDIDLDGLGPTHKFRRVGQTQTFDELPSRLPLPSLGQISGGVPLVCRDVVGRLFQFHQGLSRNRFGIAGDKTRQYMRSQL